MSDATYRIDTEHTPGEAPSVRWAARVTRLSDESRFSFFADTEENAVAEARTWIFELTEQQPGHTVFMDDQGNTVEQYSVKA